MECQADPDSGSQANLMDVDHFTKLQQEAKHSIALRAPKNKLVSVSRERLKIKGMFKGMIATSRTEIIDCIYVMEGTLGGPMILSESALLQLGLMTYDTAEKSQKVCQVKPELSVLDQLKKEFPSVFSEELGCFANIEAELTLEPGAKGYVARPRRVPLHWETATREQIQKLIDLDVCGWCDPNQRLRFCAALVLVAKKNKLTPRLCIDFRPINAYLLRMRMTSKLNIDNLIQTLIGLRYFFKLDLSNAYWQIRIAKDSQYLLACQSPWGAFFWKRLPQGLSVSSDIFDSAMSQILSGLENAVFYRDDVIGGGRTPEEHDETLRKVIERFAEAGVNLDSTKTMVGQTSIEFLGYIMSDEGLRPSPKKVHALKHAPKPTTQEGIISFLAAVQFNERFIPRLAERSAALSDLARTKGTLVWTPEAEASFEDIRSALVADCLNVTFDPEKETALFLDAGQKAFAGPRGGLSAILVQRTGVYDSWRACHYASRRLSDVESRYSQVEKECECFRWALAKKFLFYLQGISKEFTVFTDCKALLPIFNNKDKQNLPPRLERTVLAVQHLPFKVEHVKGSENCADFLSRSPVQNDDDEENLEEDQNEENLMIKAIQISEDGPISWAEIKEETGKCPELQELREAIRSNHFSEGVKKYKHLRNELTVIDDVVFKQHKVFVPEKLRGKTTERAMTPPDQAIPPVSYRRKVAKVTHICGHQGIQKTLSLLKERFYWPGVAKDVEEAVKNCSACKYIRKDHRKEPMKTKALPPRPWHTLCCDFKGPIAPSSKYCFVIWDCFSRWFEVYITYSTSMDAIRKHMLNWISAHGSLAVMYSDNGPPFNSKAFKLFAKEQGFRHKKLTPRHPRSNEAEGAMRVVKRTIEVCKLLKLPFEEEIHRQLSGYRATINLATGYSPAKLAGVTPYPVYRLGDDPDAPVVPTPEIDRDKLMDIVTARKERNYRPGRNVKPHNFYLGQKVLVNLDSPDNEFKYELEPYIIININGSSIEAVNSDGKKVFRDSTKFKAFEFKASGKSEDEEASGKSAGEEIEVAVESGDETSASDQEEHSEKRSGHVDPIASAEPEITSGRPRRRTRKDGAASPQPWVLPTRTRRKMNVNE